MFWNHCYQIMIICWWNHIVISWVWIHDYDFMGLMSMTMISCLMSSYEFRVNYEIIYMVEIFALAQFRCGFFGSSCLIKPLYITLDLPLLPVASRWHRLSVTVYFTIHSACRAVARFRTIPWASLGGNSWTLQYWLCSAPCHVRFLKSLDAVVTVTAIVVGSNSRPGGGRSGSWIFLGAQHMLDFQRMLELQRTCSDLSIS